MTRPRYQAGSLLVRGKRKKMYVARFYEDVIGSEGTLRRVRRSVILGPVSEIGSERAARNKLDELLQPVNKGQKPKLMLTFGEFVQEHWQPKILCLFKLSTQIGYRPLLSRHLVPYFKPVLLSEIGPAQVQGFLSEKAKARLSWHTLRNLRNLLSCVFRTAVEWEYLVENPVTRTKLPPHNIRPNGTEFLTPAQVRQLAAELHEPYRSMVLVAVLTGLRRGELFGLRWGAVDLKKGTLEVRESVYRGRASTPKTKSSYRRIPLSAPVVQLLTTFKSQQQLNGREAGLVFASRRGTPINPDNVLKRALHPACKRLGLPPVGWHIFRHTHATLLSDLGESLRTAQALLGHSDLDTTLAFYTHAVPESEQRATERLAKLILDPNGPKLDRDQEERAEKPRWIQ